MGAGWGLGEQKASKGSVTNVTNVTARSYIPPRSALKAPKGQPCQSQAREQVRGTQEGQMAFHRCFSAVFGIIVIYNTYRYIYNN